MKTGPKRKEKLWLKDVLLDPEDEWLRYEFAWNLQRSYVRAFFWDKKEKRTFHTMIQHMILGRPIDGREIDHINRNPMDNRRCNLRFATRSENCINRGSTTGRLKGIQARGKRWRAQITHHGKITCLGTFDTPEEAHQAYLDAGGIP